MAKTPGGPICRNFTREGAAVSRRASVRIGTPLGATGPTFAWQSVNTPADPARRPLGARRHSPGPGRGESPGRFARTGRENPRAAGREPGKPGCAGARTVRSWVRAGTRADAGPAGKPGNRARIGPKSPETGAAGRKTREKPGKKREGSRGRPGEPEPAGAKRRPGGLPPEPKTLSFLGNLVGV